jgi:pantothenate kinase type III
VLLRVGDVLGEAPLVVATGGWSPFLRQHLDLVHHTDPHLVLRGIHALMILNPA